MYPRIDSGTNYLQPYIKAVYKRDGILVETAFNRHLAADSGRRRQCCGTSRYTWLAAGRPSAAGAGQIACHAQRWKGHKIDRVCCMR